MSKIRGIISSVIFSFTMEIEIDEGYFKLRIKKKYRYVCIKKICSYVIEKFTENCI